MTDFNLRNAEASRRRAVPRRRSTCELEPLVLGGQEYRPEPAEVPAKLTITKATSGSVYELAFRAQLHGPCFRCLARRRDRAVDRRAPSTRRTNPTATRSSSSPYVADDTLDLSAWARDALALELPDKILHSPDCAGLCPVCGKDLNEEPHAHEEVAADPRWAALDALRDRALGPVRTSRGEGALRTGRTADPAVYTETVKFPVHRRRLLAACGVLAVVAGSLAVWSAASPGAAGLQTYRNEFVTFKYPAAWAPSVFTEQTLHFHPMVYLSTQPTHDPCRTTPSAGGGSTTACSWPVGRLAPGGVVVRPREPRRAGRDARELRRAAHPHRRTEREGLDAEAGHVSTSRRGRNRERHDRAAAAEQLDRASGVPARAEPRRAGAPGARAPQLDALPPAS